MPLPSISPLAQRRAALDALAAERFDIVVIGGGINGAGIARDAAMRGLRTALVEQDDFASGTSSRSSRLVHGGVRYLEHGQLKLVFESSRERRTLLRIAPHLVRPLSFTWPVYCGARLPRWKLALGLTLYDVLALFRNVARHTRLSIGAVLSREPRLDATNLVGGAGYWDAATDDARLTLANVISAHRAGAVIANHARVVGLLRDGERIAGVTVTDAQSTETIDVRARVVVNAAGPWSDRVEVLAGARSRAGVRGSKGVHVSVPQSRVGNAAALTLIAPQDGRVMFVLPSGEFTIIGTTDTFDDVAPEDVRASTNDVRYLLEAANRYFVEARLDEGDVVSAWAGLRPLAATADSEGSTAGSVSREHAISETSPGLVRVTGGKLTTYRSMSREVVDLVQRSLGERPARSTTSETLLPGGALGDLAESVGEAARIVGDARVAARLVHAYGSEWPDVWALAEADPALRQRIVAERPYLLAEVAHAVEHEMALSLGDVLVRRMPLAFETRDHGHAAARCIAAVVAGRLQWTPAERERALDDYDAEAARIFTVDGGG